MRATVTIALTGTCHNKPWSSTLSRHHRLVLLVWFSALPGVSGCAAISSIPSPVTEVRELELAKAVPCAVFPLGRVRVDAGRQIPTQVVQELCDEFSLVLITNEAMWSAVTSRCHLPGEPARVDFSQGAVVGLIANVGESASMTWPVALQTARVLRGEASLDFAFSVGLYYPVKTAGYMELAYVPGLRTVRLVQVGRRSFILRLSGEN